MRLIVLILEFKNPVLLSLFLGCMGWGWSKKGRRKNGIFEKRKKKRKEKRDCKALM
jgi:hypothetical protein